MGTPWGDHFTRLARRFGDRVAIRARGQVRDYATLSRNAARFAGALYGHGVRPGDRVALMVTDRVEALECYLGCAVGGYTAVHVNDRLRAPEVRDILTDAEVSVFVHTDDRADEVARVGDLPIVVSIGGSPAAGTLSYQDLLASAQDQPVTGPVDPDTPAIIGYTSGTTGTAKGVVITHRNLFRIIQHMPIHYGLRPGSRCAFTGTFSFVAGIWGVVLPHLYLGGELSFMAGVAPDEWVDRMVREQSTFTYVPTPLAGAFVEQVRRRPEVLSTLTGVLHSASALRPEVMADLVGVLGGRFVETWGMTETGAPVTATVPADWLPGCVADDIYASVGRPVHIASVRVLGPDGTVAPAGETGELAVSSDTLFAGYHRRPAQTDEVLADGWLRTGDVGRVDAAGYVYITDRLKDLVVTGGMNVYPAEVERVLATMPGIADVAVFGAPDQRWGETVVAAVVVAPGQSVDAAGVIDFARQRLASYKKPTSVFFVDALPRNAALKVRKSELRDRYRELEPSPYR